MKTERSRGKRLVYGAAAVLLSCGFMLQNVKLAAADALHELSLDDTCTAASTLPVDGISCFVNEVRYTIQFGTIGLDGGFSNYSADDLESVSVESNKKFGFSDEALIARTYLHLHGNDQDVNPMADGARLRFDGGNLALTDVIDKTFGLDEYHDVNGNGGGENGGNEGYVGGQSVVWEYGSGSNKIQGGVITLVEVCEPAWAYDETADPDEFMDCVNVEAGATSGGYSVEQNSRGGNVHLEMGIKAIFSITPDEGYEYDDIEFIVEPEEKEDELSGLGDDKGFEFVMPENVDIRIVAKFKQTGGTTGGTETGSESGITILPCEGEDCDDTELPSILKAEADDVPEGAALQLDPSFGGGEEDWYSFEDKFYGGMEAVAEYILSLSEEDFDSGLIYAKALKKFGKIMIGGFDLRLVDGNTGEKIDYNGKGLTITFELPAESAAIMEVLDEHYDGDYELVMAHYKSDGTIEYLPLTKNSDGTYSFTTKSLSPFGVAARAVKATNNSGNPRTADDIMRYVTLSVVSLMGLAVSGLMIRRTLK